MDAEDSFIISSRLFDEDKPFILIDISFCEKNKKKSKDFIKQFHHFTNGKCLNNISYFNKLDYKQSKMFISIKRQEQIPACKIYL